MEADLLRNKTIGSIVRIVILFAAAEFGVSGAAPDRQEADRINSALRHFGLDWIAGETAVSRLDPALRRMRLGSFLPHAPGAAEAVISFDSDTLPSSMDWRNRGGRNFMTVIKDQGNCGSCWAFSTLALIEAVFNIENDLYSSADSAFSFGGIRGGRVPYEPAFTGALQPAARIQALELPDLSEQDLISCSTAGDCDGGWESDALIFIKNRGVVSESCFPYAAENMNCDPCADWANRLTKIDSWRWVTRQEENRVNIKAALQKGPLIFFMEVYDDFYYYRRGVYEPLPDASYEAGHSVLAVGYDESEACWICRNSWGTSWGENGYFRIRYDACATGTYVLTAEGVSSRNRAPELDPVPDQQVREAEELSLQLTGSDPDGDRLNFSISGLPEGAELTSQGLLTWTPDYTRAGVYPVTATVSDGSLMNSGYFVIRVINVKQGKGKY